MGRVGGAMFIRVIEALISNKTKDPWMGASGWQWHVSYLLFH